MALNTLRCNHLMPLPFKGLNTFFLCLYTPAFPTSRASVGEAACVTETGRETRLAVGSLIWLFGYLTYRNLHLDQMKNMALVTSNCFKSI